MKAFTFFVDTAAFRTWLQAHANTESELLVGFYKKATGVPSITWSESVDEALCFGWIDGMRKRIDEKSYYIRFTPRKPNSIWSVVNINKVVQLQAQGRMTAAGERAFALRTERKSGVYAFEQKEAIELMPQEMQTFHNNTAAWDFFQTTPPSYKKFVLHWIVTAKKTETRSGRLAKLIAACADRKRLQ